MADDLQYCRMRMLCLTRQQAIQAVHTHIGYDFRAFKVKEWLQHLSQWRKRDIHLILSVETCIEKPFGLWLRTDRRDYVVVGSKMRLHSIQFIHILAHEIGHIFLDHPPFTLDGRAPTEAMIEVIGRDVSARSVAELVESVPCTELERTSLDDTWLNREELEAEYFAMLVNQAVMRDSFYRAGTGTWLRGLGVLTRPSQYQLFQRLRQLELMIIQATGGKRTQHPKCGWWVGGLDQMIYTTVINILDHYGDLMNTERAWLRDEIAGLVVEHDQSYPELANAMSRLLPEKV